MMSCSTRLSNPCRPMPHSKFVFTSRTSSSVCSLGEMPPWHSIHLVCAVETTAQSGMAWKHTRDQQPSINLYSSDGSHPSVAGTYLAACTFYATLFQCEFYNIGLAAADELNRLKEKSQRDRRVTQAALDGPAREWWAKWADYLTGLTAANVVQLGERA